MLTIVPGLLPGLDLRRHFPGYRLADEERALQVHAQHAVEIGFLQIEEIGAVDDAGVVDQHVDAAGRLGLRHEVRHVAGVAHVAADEAGVRSELLGGRPAGGLVDVGEDDLGAFRDQPLGAGAPDAAGGAGDDGGPAIEFGHASTLSPPRREREAGS